VLYSRDTMNILCKLSRFQNEKIQFMDTKHNIMMNGQFTKIVYSTEHYTMNGLYLQLPLLIEYPHAKTATSTNDAFPYHYLQFQPYHQKNHMMVQQLVDIEFIILQYYKQYVNCSKNPAYGLRNQLYGGMLKLYTNGTNVKTSITVKISGVWETHDSIGITYKFLL